MGHRRFLDTSIQKLTMTDPPLEMSPVFPGSPRGQVLCLLRPWPWCPHGIL